MEPLELTRLLLLVVHFVGLAAIIGAYILQMPRRSGFDFSPVLVGSIVQLVSGIALIAVNEIGGTEIDRAKAIVKLGLALVVLVLALVGVFRGRALARSERTDAPLRSVLWGAGIVAIANVAVAVFWR